MSDRFIVPEVPHEVADGTVQRAPGELFPSPNALKLGVFGSNVSGGANGPSFAGEAWKLNNWQESEVVAAAADRAGFEAFVPIVRWKGFEGPSGYWDRSYETFLWGAGLAKATERIRIFTTCLMATIHPVMAAKMGTTLDHISGGRWGMNTVPGFHGPEFRMFGIELGDRSKRYRHAQEWLDIVYRLWETDEPFDFDGEFFDFEQAVCRPKPMQTPRPPIMNAGQSEEGRAFAVNNADMIFINSGDGAGIVPNIASIRQIAAEAKKEVSVWGNIHVLVRETEKEVAQAIGHYSREHGDPESVRRYMKVIMGTDSGAHAAIRENPEAIDFTLLGGGNKTVHGTPEQVVDQIIALRELGIDGLTMTWNNYADDLERHMELVEPLLVEAGLRSPDSPRLG
jgi:alkanesulfonate monooxygenase SsuD/methylene tetrahydromethanopterin reductase-like flavin-dependent oxidoreductase (luciferase family)